ncbi:MAG: hypothetical protein Q8O35_14035, partial [Humidesulfovibrio sp.]|uniref:hypothetical protein n=1 Tax=Humidesulfovibrio sp. TaxID=2910988 RepID=UPI002732CA49
RTVSGEANFQIETAYASDGVGHVENLVLHDFPLLFNVAVTVRPQSVVEQSSTLSARRLCLLHHLLGNRVANVKGYPKR